MRIGKTIRKIVALGTGVTMVGATILGAMAAADLADYPSPFVADGKFSGIIVVGADAATSDVIGSVDVATSLQFASKTTSVVDVGATGTVSLTGDSWKAETSSKKLELTESISSIKSAIGEDELNALGDGTFKTGKGTYAYEQTLRAQGQINSMNLTYEEDTDNEIIGVFLKLDNNDKYANYTLTFSTAAETDIDVDEASELEDYKDRHLSILGKKYTIVMADYVGTDDVELTLMGGAVSDTLLEGSSKTYTLDDNDYEVEVVFVDADEVKFAITKDGEVATTKKMNVGESESVHDQTIGVSEILYQDYAGGIHSVDLFFGVDKVVLKDNTATGALGVWDGTMHVGEEKMDEIDVSIKGSNSSDGTDFLLESMAIRYSADDDIWIAAGEKLSDKLDEPEGLINWDISFEGLTTEPTEDIKLVGAGGDKEYQLKFTVADGEVKLPLAYSSGENKLILGDDNYRLILNTNANESGALSDGNASDTVISKSRYFFLTDAADETGKTYVLQYKGADSSSGDTMATLKFKNLATGDVIKKSIACGNASTATLSLGGFDYTVKAQTQADPGIDDFNITVSGNQENIIITKNDAKIGIYASNETHDTYSDTEAAKALWYTFNTTFITVNVTEADPGDMLEGDVQTVFEMNITGDDSNDIGVDKSSGGINGAVFGGEVSFVTDTEDSDIQTAMTRYGAKITYTTRSSAPDNIDIEWPAQQRVGQAFIISGPVQTVTTTGAGEVESAVITKIEVGAAMLDSEVADITAQNAIIIGGPCVNDAAAEAMGLSPGTCGAASTIPENKAIIKLFEQAGGNVAMVVAGWGAMDTRRACRVVANYADYALSGAEMEVSGTDLTTITVAAPAVEEAEEEEEEEAEE